LGRQLNETDRDDILYFDKYREHDDSIPNMTEVRGDREPGGTCWGLRGHR
jgi:hypothetical protein